MDSLSRSWMCSGGPDLGGTRVSTMVSSPPVSSPATLIMSRSPKAQSPWPPPGGSWMNFDGSCAGSRLMARSDARVSVVGMHLVGLQLDEGDDEDRVDQALQQVPAGSGAVPPAHHHVAVHRQDVLLGRQDVPRQAEHLDLLLMERDLVEPPRLEVEEPEPGLLEAADRRERRGVDVVAGDVLGEPVDALLPRVEEDQVRALGADVLVEDPAVHGAASLRQRIRGRRSEAAGTRCRSPAPSPRAGWRRWSARAVPRCTTRERPRGSCPARPWRMRHATPAEAGATSRGTTS